MKNKIDKLKKFLQENYPNIQAFNNRSMSWDYVENVYNQDNIQVDYAPRYEYIEIFGLSNEEFEGLLDKKGCLKTFSEYKKQNKINIQVGDRVTYKVLDKNETGMLIIDHTGIEEVLMDTTYYEILKTERPKYEVVEELLTDEEKEFLKQILRFMETRIMSINIKEDIKSNKKEIHFNQNKDGYGLDYWYYIKNNTFNKLKIDKVYTLEELGLD